MVHLLRLLLVAILCLPVVSQAQQVVSPVLVDREVQPRDKESVTITLENPTERQIRVYPTVNEVTVDDAGTITEFTNRSQSDNRVTVTSWLAINRGRIELSPGETREVSLELDVHPQAAPGVYHTFIGFPSGGNRPAAAAKVTSNEAPGSLVRIEVLKDLSAYLTLGQFSVDKFITDPKGETLTYTIENPSETPLQPTGEIIVYGSYGEELGAVELQDLPTIAPQTEEAFTVTMPDVEQRFGRNKAMLAIRYGEGQTALLQDTIYFYQVPLYRLLAIFLLTLLVAMGIAYWIHRRYQADHDAQHRVAMYHRPDIEREEKDHDLNLKSTDETST